MKGLEVGTAVGGGVIEAVFVGMGVLEGTAVGEGTMATAVGVVVGATVGSGGIVAKAACVGREDGVRKICTVISDVTGGRVQATARKGSQMLAQKINIFIHHRPASTTATMPGKLCAQSVSLYSGSSTAITGKP